LVIAQADVWWADLPEPRGSEPGYYRPVIVIQSDALNASRIATVLCVMLTSELKWAKSPGNVLLGKAATGLPRDSVANVSAIATLDKSRLIERAGRLSRAKMNLVFTGIDFVLGRSRYGG